MCLEIPETLKTRLLSELNFVIRKVRDEIDEARKLYFLSAAHGAIERTTRFHSDSELLIAHALLNMCYNVLLDRFNRIKAGDKVIPLPNDWSEQIVDYLSQLKELIEQNQSVYPALERIMQLVYSVTGPGHYTTSYLESLASS